MHTSASLSINENADPAVRTDLSATFTKLVPHDKKYEHKFEGSDDMPAHALSATIGVSLTIPITEGRFVLGTWQGIYLNEHRNFGGDRKILATYSGISRQ